MQFSLPQFIDVKEKIFGPLTLTQFIYIAAGGGMSFLLFQVLEIGLFIVVAFPIMVVCVMLAFYKYNGMPFSSLVLSMVRYLLFRPRVRVWKRMVETNIRRAEEAKKISEGDTQHKELLDKSSLQKLTYVLDTEGGALLHDKGDDTNRVSNAELLDSQAELSQARMDKVIPQVQGDKKKRAEELLSGLY